MPTKSILPHAVLLTIISLLLFELTPLDLWLQQFFFDTHGHHWVLSASERISHLIFYDAPRLLFTLFVLVLGISLLFARRLGISADNARNMRIVLLSLILVPGCVSLLKTATDVACPRDLTMFGGNVAYASVFEHHAKSSETHARRRCFPAGHASGGFALMSLSFLFSTRRNRRRAMYFGLTVGWTTGIYKILIGDHFIGHTVISMCLAWTIIQMIASIEHHRLSRRKSREFAAPETIG